MGWLTLQIIFWITGAFWLLAAAEMLRSILSLRHLPALQSFPEPRTIRAVVPEGELNPSSRVMEHHQRSPDGNLLITNTMAREMPIPKDFDSFSWMSQINQAMAMRTAVEHWRRIKPWCMGALYWQLGDLWPVASWSSIDYHGRWKVLHHDAARFFAPLRQ